MKLNRIELFAKKQNADFQSVMAGINGTFDRINDLLFEVLYTEKLSLSVPSNIYNILTFRPVAE